ncbi:MAG: hypothetical protein RMJ81_07745 [Candidatus Kryptonium sp.]|nr:hypothetical protein [Candidatus Kryptonium sp.]MCX7761483.1 hypothetical protein [Candidatus Kryptonium sp.]MDW8109529.1 hypothetical protein [Candidatus Kryptonium sp.]
MSSKTKAIILVIVCILIGFGLGILVDRTFLLKHHPRRGLKEYRKELIERLKLNQEQQVRLDSILSWSQREFKNLSREFRPKFDSLKSALRDSIRAILTPEQINEFEKMIKETEKNGRR